MFDLLRCIEYHTISVVCVLVHCTQHSNISVVCVFLQTVCRIAPFLLCMCVFVHYTQYTTSYQISCVCYCTLYTVSHHICFVCVFLYTIHSIPRFLLCVCSLHCISEGQESRSCLGLKNKGTKILGLVQNVGDSSRMKMFGPVLSRYRPICFNYTQSRIVLVLIWISSF